MGHIPKSNKVTMRKMKISLSIHLSVCYIIILVLGLTEFTKSSPLYDVYRVEQEPEPIPMNLLKETFQIDFPRNEVNEEDELEFATPISKRIQHSGSSHSDSSSDSTFPNLCCPTVMDVIQPNNGKNRSGDLVELYQSENVRQRFYENSCAPAVVDAPCRFLDRKHTLKSRCVQQYSYTYALIRDFGTAKSDWKLDYIQFRSGCACHIAH